MPPESDWQRSWRSTRWPRVRVSRELLPAWLERGRGCFVVTAPTAGLLTMPGAALVPGDQAPAGAHAEWLAATHGHRELTVHCVCP
jgi:hypothetical protein